MTAEGEADKVRMRMINTRICITSYMIFWQSSQVLSHIRTCGYLSHIVEYLSRADMQPYIHRPGRS
jgi:hypothetical protein